MLILFNITYDLVLLCEVSSLITTWNSGSASRDASTTTSNLVAVSQVGTAMGTTPTAPTEVD